MKQMLKVLCVLLVATISTVSGGMTNSGYRWSRDGSIGLELTNLPEGTLDMTNTTFVFMLNYGTAKLGHCVMTDEVLSFGTFDATETQFQKDLTVGGGETFLTSCQLENLYISDDLSDNLEVTLKGKTVINGSVIFKVGQGKVYKGPEVVITGKVVNGTLSDLNEQVVELGKL
jgi:hypothetical protein